MTVVVLLLGWRAGIIIGSIVPLTILSGNIRYLCHDFSRILSPVAGIVSLDSSGLEIPRVLYIFTGTV